MSERIKKYLGLAGIVILLAGAYSIVSFANSFSASIQPSSFRSFAVNAEGKATSIPDVAKFSYSVVTEGDTNIKALTDKNTTKSNGIIAFLKKSGIDEEDIKTTNYSLEPRTKYYSCGYRADGVKPCPPSEIVGYTVRQSGEVKVRDFTKIGEILAGVTTNGANDVSDLQFTTDDPTKIEDLARANAIEKAIAKAELIAKTGNFKVGRLLSIEESNYNPTPYYESFVPKMMSAGVVATPTIEAGSQETKINITLRYEIK
ncbi:MAG: SIMPL domain-containing protein [Candidatus Vogelbacteria bacterium]|nr:SIMPL domain-containing protein [Candidatus Vogelbacteria bacterium]